MGKEPNATDPRPPEKEVNLRRVNAYAGDVASSAYSEPSTAEADSLTKSLNSITTANVENANSNTALKHQIGNRISNASDLINDNLIVVRYATISTVLLLGVYGVANTPLFYRYTNVRDLPAKMFRRRKWIHGRVVGIAENETAGAPMTHNAQSSQKASNWGTSSSNSSPQSQSKRLASLLSSSLQRARGAADGGDSFNSDDTTADAQPEQRPITVLFRHSSPMERLLTQSAMDKVLSITGKSPSRLLYSSANPYRHLLRIELAGVVAPPFNTSSSSILSSSLTGEADADHFPLLNELIQKKTKVKLQMLAQRTHNNNLDENTTEEKQLPTDDNVRDAAICHLHYRRPKQWFATTNACLEMVQQGQAWINSCGMVVPLSTNVEGNDDASRSNENTTAITDFNPTVKQLQSDTNFLSRLEEAEYSSWQSKAGMWSSDRNRALRTEYAEEEEYLKNKWSNSFGSLLRRGWEWIRR